MFLCCVCNTIIAETWKCKLQKNANEAFPRLQHFEYFYPRSVSITIGDGKCKMYLHCCTLLHLRVEPVWSLRFEPSSAFALSDRKSNFEVTTKMFICCVPHYWLTGPHPCLHLHPLWAAPVIKGQFSVHPPLHPGSIKSGIIHISQPGICHCVLVHSQLLRELLLITILGPPSPAIIRSTLSWIFRF